MADLVSGLIALAIAGAFLGLIANRVPAPALLIVFAIGFACMVASLVEEVRRQRRRA